MTNNYSSMAIFEQSECLFEEKAIDQALDTMAEAITREMAALNPLCLIVMTGGVVFAGQLLPKLQFPLHVDYLHATRYRGQFKGADAIHWLAQPTLSLVGRHVLILDDVLDAGVTLAEIEKYCEAHGAASVRTAVLVDKDVPKAAGGVQKADFTALRAPNVFLFGYGMDCDHFWRNAPGIYGLINS